MKTLDRLERGKCRTFVPSRRHLSLHQITQQAVHVVQAVDAGFAELSVLDLAAGQHLDQPNQFVATAHLIVQVPLDEAGKLFVYETGERLFLGKIVNRFRFGKQMISL